MTPEDILRKARSGGGGMSVPPPAPTPGKTGGVDWSRIGRKSRRKGKGFECEIAACLRAATKCDWQTTRNSGRTDLGGDIYTPNGEYAHVMVECKSRKSFSMRDIVFANKGYINEMQMVVAGWEKRREKILIVVIRTDLGLWVAGLMKAWCPPWPVFKSPDANTMLRDDNALEWSHIGHTTRFECSPVVEQLIRWIGRAGAERPESV